MNNKERLELAKWVVSNARKNGADDASADISNVREIEVSIRESEIENLTESTRNSLNLGIYANKKYSNHSTNDIRKDKLGKFIREAVSMTKYLSEDEFRSLPDPKYYEGREKKDIHIYDPLYEKISTDERIRIAKEIEKIAVSGSEKIISCAAAYSDTRSESVKVHSNGFEGMRESTRFSKGASVTVRDDSGGRPEAWFWGSVRYHKDLPTPEFVAKQAVERALNKIGQEKLPSGQYDMILENRAVGRLFYALYGPLRAQSIQQKSSFLEGKLGRKIGSDKLTIIDDPFIEYGLGSRLYDSEGISTKRRIIIDKGILKSFYVDYYYGRKLGMEPTIGSPTNIDFEHGNRSLNEIIKNTARGILVDRFIGGNSNPTTGDFSYGIMGRYIENGEFVKPVGEMNINGNHNEFWMNLVELGNDPYIYSSWRFPSMVFKNVQFSGV